MKTEILNLLNPIKNIRIGFFMWLIVLTIGAFIENLIMTWIIIVILLSISFYFSGFTIRLSYSGWKWMFKQFNKRLENGS